VHASDQILEAIERLTVRTLAPAHVRFIPESNTPRKPLFAILAKLETGVELGGKEPARIPESFQSCASGPSKAWLKVKNPKAPAATRAVDGTF